VTKFQYTLKNLHYDVIHKTESNYQNTYHNKFLNKKMHRKNIQENSASLIFLVH